jgi:hypothetical protein
MLVEATGLDGFFGAAAFLVGDVCAACPGRDLAGIASFLPG